MTGGWRPAAVATALAIAALIAAAQVVQAWASLQREQVRPAWGAAGTPVAVLLTNGQVYYGELAEQSASHLRLVNVYYVQTVAAPDAAQPSNQLVNRAKADWHGPQWMSIPAERIVFVEGIGQDSRLAQLIAQEKKLAPAK
jgi:hypothetical protein